MSIGVYIRALVTPQTAELLANAPERGIRSRNWLAGRIIEQWVADPKRRKISAPAARLAAGELSPAQRAIARRRERVLKAWFAEVTRRPSRSVDEATRAFLASLPRRLRVSRRTLYNWHLRYQGDGVAGLADHRQTVDGMTRGKTIKRRSKAA